MVFEARLMPTSGPWLMQIRVISLATGEVNQRPGLVQRATGAEHARGIVSDISALA